MKTLVSFRTSFSARLACAVVVTLGTVAVATPAFCGPIHDAARKGDVKKVKEFLASDPKLVNDKDKTEILPCIRPRYMARSRSPKCSSMPAPTSTRRTITRLSSPTIWARSSPASNHQDPVILLHSQASNTTHALNTQGVTANDLKDGYTPLDLAEFAANHNKLVQLLVAHGADVNARATSGATPLFWAVMRDQKDDVKFLLDHGANPNLADAYGDTILDCALHLGFQTEVGLLVDKGADVNAQDQRLHRPFSYALQNHEDTAVGILKKHGAHE